MMDLDANGHWIDWHAEFDREAERDRQQLEARVEREAQEAATRAREREDRDIATTIRRDEAAGYRLLIETLARRHRITIEWREQMPRGAAAFSVWRTRTVTIPPIDLPNSAAVKAAIALHEIGHILAGACPNRGLHRRNAEVADW